MYNSYSKSPHFDFSKCVNVSPLMPKLDEEKQTENHQWVGSNKNLLGNKTVRPGVDLEEKEVDDAENVVGRRRFTNAKPHSLMKVPQVKNFESERYSEFEDRKESRGVGLNQQKSLFNNISVFPERSQHFQMGSLSNILGNMGNTSNLSLSSSVLSHGSTGAMPMKNLAIKEEDQDEGELEVKKIPAIQSSLFKSKSDDKLNYSDSPRTAKSLMSTYSHCKQEDLPIPYNYPPYFDNFPHLDPSLQQNIPNSPLNFNYSSYSKMMNKSNSLFKNAQIPPFDRHIVSYFPSEVKINYPTYYEGFNTHFENPELVLNYDMASPEHQIYYQNNRKIKSFLSKKGPSKKNKKSKGKKNATIKSDVEKILEMQILEKEIINEEIVNEGNQEPPAEYKLTLTEDSHTQNTQEDKSGNTRRSTRIINQNKNPCHNLIEKVKKEIKDEIHQFSNVKTYPTHRPMILSEIVNQSLINSKATKECISTSVNSLVRSGEDFLQIKSKSKNKMTKSKVQRARNYGNTWEILDKYDKVHGQMENEENVFSFRNFVQLSETQELNSTCRYFNPEIKGDYLQYLIYGKANEKNLSFGRDPSSLIADLVHCKEMEMKRASSLSPNELQVSAMRTNFYINKAKEVEECIKHLPRLKIPEDSNIHKYNKKPHTKSKKKQAPDQEIFKCRFCTKFFDSRQGLGGHVSRMHKGKSETYNKKAAVRLRRQEEREKLREIKRIIVNNSGHDFDDLLDNKRLEGKKVIKTILEHNRAEYLRLKREMKRKLNK